MLIHINSDRDIKDFMAEHITAIMHKLDYIYKTPAYRSYINLGSFEGELFLEIILTSAMYSKFQLKWIFPTDTYVKELEKFGFVDKYTLQGYTTYTYLKSPSGFTFQQENSLLEILFGLLPNMPEYIKRKYGLR